MMAVNKLEVVAVYIIYCVMDYFSVLFFRLAFKIFIYYEASKLFLNFL